MSFQMDSRFKDITPFDRKIWLSSLTMHRDEQQYSNVRLVIVAHLYSTPGKLEEIKKICDTHEALMVKDAVKSLGAKYALGEKWVETGTLGNYRGIGRR